MRPQTEMLLEKTRKFFSTVKHIYSRWEIERWIETKGMLALSETEEGRERVGEKETGCWRHTHTLLGQTSFGKHAREGRYAYKGRIGRGWRTLMLITGASLQIIWRTAEQKSIWQVLSFCSFLFCWKIDLSCSRSQAVRPVVLNFILTSTTFPVIRELLDKD